jgi:hypothetical protein
VIIIHYFDKAFIALVLEEGAKGHQFFQGVQALERVQQPKAPAQGYALPSRLSFVFFGSMKFSVD